MDKMRVLLTGASGFLGYELLSQLGNAGFPVRATDRRPLAAKQEADFLFSDILNPETLKAALANIDCVIHAAGLAHVFGKTNSGPGAFKEVNETGTLNTARAAVAAGVKHFILISSVSVYGKGDSNPDEEHACLPRGPYAESKYLAEMRAIETAEKSDMDLTILRLATVYGEGGDPGNVGRLIKMIDAGRFFWVGSGTNQKSLIHRHDVAKAVLAVVNSGREPLQIFNVSSPPCTMTSIVNLIHQFLGKKISGWNLSPAFANFIFSKLDYVLSTNLSDSLAKWLSDDTFNAAKFYSRFNYNPDITLEEGLKREVAWYLTSKNRT